MSSSQKFILLFLLHGITLGSCGNNYDAVDQETIAKTAAEARQNELILKGEALFNLNCRKCHQIFHTDNYLSRVTDRLDSNYFRLYLTRQDSLIAAKDEYALRLKEGFCNLGNAHNFQFLDSEVRTIIAYLEKYSP